MTHTQYSTDDGITWHDAPKGLRIVCRETCEDDDSFKDLHVQITHEGVVLDVIDQITGQIESSQALPFEKLVDLIHN